MQLNLWIEQRLPRVPRAPNFRSPNRKNGKLIVVISGVILRITITSEGFAGKSLLAMMKAVYRFLLF